MTTTPDIRPGTVLYLSVRNSPSHQPQVSQALYCVSRVTATQAIAIGEHNREIRVRLEDLKVIGQDYCRAGIATEELQAKHAAQVDELARYRAANAQVDDLIGRSLHQLKLTTEQLEALAKAWAEIKQIKD